MFINLSCYHFLVLENLPQLREQLRNLCHALNLKGTILLAPEGINFFVAGRREATDQLMTELRTILELPHLTAKESESDKQPFRRMLVKVKQEIIAFGVEGINPARHTSPYLKPQTLKTWLDEGKPLVLLDTRNDYEVRMGTFKNAVPAKIRHFRNFPEAIKKLPPEWKNQTMVTFCTGGIRCEKAAPFLEREGFQQVFQLEGGILNYFKECGGAHYQGECFVFDQRVGVNPQLEETTSVMCFACQMPLTLEEQQHPHFKIEESCPHCFGQEKPAKPPKTRRKRRNEERIPSQEQKR
ncbi:MAG: sulfurtransferase [Chthoniobacterales bacterium]|nr:sulfurtransferase [Chthoniobacterales bacterium]